MAHVQVTYLDHDRVAFLIGPNNCLLLEYESYLYKRINGKVPKTTWTCRNRNCKVTVKTDNGVFLKAQRVSMHDHPPPIDDILVIKTNMCIKSRIQSEFHLTPRQIHTQERTKLLLSQEHSAHLQMDSFTKSRCRFNRQRQATFPPNPKNIEDIDIPEDWKLTLDKADNFLLANDTELGTSKRIMIFGTDENLRILCNAEYVVCDGTFKIHPKKLFAQLYIFHAPYLGKVLPLLFCLLPSKSGEIYSRLLALIEQAAKNIDLEFKPPRIHTDYELAMINSVRSAFPGDRVQGCLFHFNQSIWRKVNNLGFSEAYKKFTHIRQWVRRLSAIPMLPIHDIDDGFLEVHESAPEPMPGIISREQIRQFHDYMVDTWVSDTDAIYKRHLWNQYENGGPRTTNNAEGFHNKLNQQASFSSVSIYLFFALSPGRLRCN